MYAARIEPQQPLSNRKGHWIPWAFVVAMLLVAAVNGIMVMYALESWPGLAAQDAYETGRTYNRVLQEAQHEAALGWTMQVDFAADRNRERHGNLLVRATGRDGKELSDLAVHVTLVRPLGPQSDIALDLPHVAGGRYAAALDLPQSGQWEVRLAAAEGNRIYQVTRRIIVP